LSATTLERGSRSKLNLLHDSDFGIGNKKEISKMADFVKNDKKNNNGKRNFNNRNNNNGNPRNNYAKKRETLKAPDVCAGTVEYKMSKVMADEILNMAKGKSGKLSRPAQEVLCEFVNSQMGLKGYCVNVLVEVN
jgi:hypothetical protein